MIAIECPLWQNQTLLSQCLYILVSSTTCVFVYNVHYIVDLWRIHVLCLYLCSYVLLYVRVGILLICGQHLHDRIISPRGEVFTEVPVRSQESKRSRVCVLVVPMMPLKTIYQWGCGILTTVWFFFFFPFYSYIKV